MSENWKQIVQVYLYRSLECASNTPQEGECRTQGQTCTVAMIYAGFKMDTGQFNDHESCALPLDHI